MLIDCDTCQVRDLACGDCVVSVLLGPPQTELDGAEQAAIAVLASSGLVPPLRLVPVDGAAVAVGDPGPPTGPEGRRTSKDRDGRVKRRATG